MDEHLDPCTRFWCHVAAGGDPEAPVPSPGRLDHLITCSVCRAEFASLVTRWSGLRATLAPPEELASWTQDRVQAIVEAMRRAADGDEPVES